MKMSLPYPPNNESIVKYYFSLDETKRKQQLREHYEHSKKTIEDTIKHLDTQEITFKGVVDSVSTSFILFNQTYHLLNLLNNLTLLDKEQDADLIQYPKEIFELLQNSDYYTYCEQLLSHETDPQKLQLLNIIKSQGEHLGAGLSVDEKKQLLDIKEQIDNCVKELLNKKTLDDKDFDTFKSLLIHRLQLAHFFGYSDYTSYKLSNYYYNTPEKINRVLSRKIFIQSNLIPRKCFSTQFERIMFDSLEYIGSLFDVTFTQSFCDINQGITSFDVSRSGKKIGNLSILDSDNVTNSSTRHLRAYSNINQDEILPEVCIVLKRNKDEDVTVSTIRELFHEMGHALFMLFSHNDYPDLNDYISSEFKEFNSKFLESFVQNFLMVKYRIELKVIECLCPQKAIDRAKDFITIHQAQNESSIDNIIDEMKRNASDNIAQTKNYIRQYDPQMAKGGYAVNKHSYIIGTYLAQKWAKEFQQAFDKTDIINRYIELCKKGKMADFEEYALF